MEMTVFNEAVLMSNNGETKEMGQLRERLNHHFVMGHNRWALVSISDAQTHIECTLPNKTFLMSELSKVSEFVGDAYQVSIGFSSEGCRITVEPNQTTTG